MENLSKREQQLAVSKILEEMQATENKLLKWNTRWWESKRNSNMIVWEICSKTLSDHSIKRKISFEYNGNVHFKKFNPDKDTKATILYADYNVLNENLSLYITSNENDETNYISVSLKENSIKIKYNHIIITQDLTTGTKIIESAYPINVYLKIILNFNNSVKEGSLWFDDENNECYNFEITESRGVKALLYRLDLSKIKKQLSNMFCRKNLDDRIIYKLFHDTVITIFQNATCSYVNPNVLNADEDSINEIIDYINVILNNVKGEIPLPGLVSRIDNFLIKNNSSRKQSGHSKKLKKKNR